MRPAWILCAAFAAASADATAHDDAVMAHMPAFVHGMFDQLEVRPGGGPLPWRWEGEMSVGTEAYRWSLRTRGTAVDGRISDGQHELLYARPLSEFFDWQVGVRYDLDALASRGWLALGVEGLAPYMIRMSAMAYAGEGGRAAARVAASAEFLLTQRLILEPQLELDAYSRADADRRLGAGISDLECGVRLRYEIVRKFAPYLGVVYVRQFGQTRRNAVAEGEAAAQWRATLGVRAWF